MFAIVSHSNDRLDQSANPAPGLFSLRILATSDLHAQLMAYDYARDCPLPSAGLTRTASLIRSARAEARTSVLLDNGDFLEGFPFGDLASDLVHNTSRKINPVIASMNMLGYDAAGLGNHEFGTPLDELALVLGSAEFPVISTNIKSVDGHYGTSCNLPLPPYSIIRRTLTDSRGQTADISIGLMSFLPPQVDQWESRHLAGRLRTEDIVESARHWIPRLKSQGTDLIVALCHSGIGSAQAQHRMENAAIPLSALDGIDLLITGHVHDVFPGPDFSASACVDPVKGTLSGKPAVMPGFWGSHLGVIDLTLRQEQTGWKIASFSTEVRPIAKRDTEGKLEALVADDAEMTDALLPVHRMVLDHIQQPIGKTDQPLHSYFARLADCAALQVVRDAQRTWLEHALLDTPYAHLPILSSSSPFKSGGRSGPQFYTEIAKGDLLRRHVTDLYVFPNTIRALLISGATLKEWLERSAAQFCRLSPGVRDQPLFEPGFAAFNFDAIDGICYAFDLQGPSRYDVRGALVNIGAERVRDLTFRGRPVDPNAHFVLATNSFRAAGGGQFPGLDISPVIHEEEVTISGILHEYIERHSRLSPRATQRWRILPPPAGTSAWFDTGPGALSFIADETSISIEPDEMMPSGFLRCHVHF